MKDTQTRTKPNKLGIFSALKSFFSNGEDKTTNAELLKEVDAIIAQQDTKRINKLIENMEMHGIELKKVKGVAKQSPKIKMSEAQNVRKDKDREIAD